jgi:adenosylhomocysteine nucleosidase
MVAAESREFEGILKRAHGGDRLEWPGAAYARQVPGNGVLWLLVANGPGPKLVSAGMERFLDRFPDVEGVVSTGFCGALDPSLRIGDIVVSGEIPRSAPAPFVEGELLSMDRVAVTAAEKQELRRSTGAAAVEMESAAVARKAMEWNVPFRSVRAVSDTALDDMPLDFNLYRDSAGRFSRWRIAAAALRRPFTAVPGLVRLDRNCRHAAESLGEFLAQCEF